MYTEWFKLSTLPFRLRPDPDYLFLGGAFDRLYVALRDAADSGHGVVCLLGDTGAGKTTLLHALARERAATTSVARIQQPNLTATELLTTLAGQFNLAATEGTRFGDHAQLMKFTAAERARGRTVLILIDEAHRCAAAMLRELLRLAEDPSAPLLILAGEPALAASLAPLLAADGTAPPLRTLHVPPLDAAQVAGYVQHRLSVSGSGDRLLFELRDFCRDPALYRRYTPAHQYAVRQRHGARRQPQHGPRQPGGDPQRRAGSQMGRVLGAPRRSGGAGTRAAGAGPRRHAHTGGALSRRARRHACRSHPGN